MVGNAISALTIHLGALTLADPGGASASRVAERASQFGGWKADSVTGDNVSEDNPKVRLPPPLIVLAGLAAGLALDGRLANPELNSVPFILAGVACAAAGLLLGISALGLFRRSGTKPEPWKPSSTLVTAGVYRFTRNPMYLGMLLLYAGIALTAGGPFTATMVLPVFLLLNFYVIPREEAYLKRRFGDGYRAYRSRVRRWL